MDRCDLCELQRLEGNDRLRADWRDLLPRVRPELRLFGLVARKSRLWPTAKGWAVLFGFAVVLVVADFALSMLIAGAVDGVIGH